MARNGRPQTHAGNPSPAHAGREPLRPARPFSGRHGPAGRYRPADAGGWPVCSWTARCRSPRTHAQQGRIRHRGNLAVVVPHGKDQAAPFAGIPVFPRRLFSCAQMYVRAGAGIRQPDDLAGRRVGLSRLCWKMASATPSGCHWPRSRRTRSPWLSISFGGRNRWVCRRCRTFRTHVVPSAKCVFMGAMPAGPQTRSASSVGHSTIGVIGPGPRADCRDVPAGVLIFGMTARSSPMSARRAASSETPTTRSPCEPRVWVPGHRAASTSSHSSCWCELASRRLTVPGRTGVPTGQPAKSPPERAVSSA